MKRSLLLFGLLLFCLSACQRKTASIRTHSSLPQPTVPASTAPPIASPVQPLDALPHAIFSLHKTPCYGKCPVFDVRFMSDGRVTWWGRQHTERVGHYEAFVTPATLARITEQIQSQQYFDLRATYPTDADRILADIPQTITKAQIDGRVWQVTNNYDAPSTLHQLERFIMRELDQLVWRKVE